MKNKPSTNIQAALDGAAPVSSLNKAEQSSLKFPVYLMAVMVLNLKGKDARRAKINTLPVDIKKLVEAEVLRIWGDRKAGS